MERAVVVGSASSGFGDDCACGSWCYVVVALRACGGDWGAMVMVCDGTMARHRWLDGNIVQVVEASWWRGLCHGDFCEEVGDRCVV